MTGIRRGAGMVALLVGAGLVATGCASRPGSAAAGPSSSPADLAARQNLAGDVHYIMNQTGLPLEYGHVGCHAGSNGRSDICSALVSNDPVTPVEGDFTASGEPGRNGCPGTLRVRFGETLVTTVAENPCR